MYSNKKLRVQFSLITVVASVVILFVSCSATTRNNLFLHSNLPVLNNAPIPPLEYEETDIIDKTIKEINYEKGVKTKVLYGNSENLSPAILVNGEAISEREIEVIKIEIESSNIIVVSEDRTTADGQDITVKKILRGTQNPTVILTHKIITAVRNSVIQGEAVRQNLQPSQAEISNFILQQRTLAECDEDGMMAGYIAGLGMTEEAYYAEYKDIAYKTLQRSALYLSFIDSQAREIKVAAEKRGVDLVVVQKEFYEKYVDELVQKATIEVLSPEIISLFAAS